MVREYSSKTKPTVVPKHTSCTSNTREAACRIVFCLPYKTNRQDMSSVIGSVRPPLVPVMEMPGQIRKKKTDKEGLTS